MNNFILSVIIAPCSLLILNKLYIHDDAWLIIGLFVCFMMDILFILGYILHLMVNLNKEE